MSESNGVGRSAWVKRALERFESPLMRFAARITGDEDRARDAVQETFLRLCGEDPAKLDGRLAPWLYTTCRHRAIDARRKDARMIAMSESTGTMDAGVALDSAGSNETRVSADPAHEAEAREGASRVLRLLARLPDNQREVIRLRFQDGLRYKEIAEATGLSVTNVGFLIHTALATLREGMKE